MFKHIGTVATLKTRIYPLDAQSSNRHGIYTEAIVEPGNYPLMSDGRTYVWLMQGTINGNTIRRGDGMFIVAADGSDNPVEGLTVIFPSRMYGPDEWADLLADPTAIEGHREQRLRITVL